MKKTISFIAFILFAQLFLIVGCSEKSNPKPETNSDTLLVSSDSIATKDTVSNKDKTEPKKAKKNKLTPKVTKSTKDSANYLIYKYKAEYGDCFKKEDVSCADVDLVFVLYKSKDKNSVHEKINSQLIKIIFSPAVDEKTYKNAEEFSRSVFASFDELKKENVMANANYSVDRNLKIHEQGKYVVSTFDEYKYLSGAHPTTTTIFDVFSLTTGNKVKLSDVIINKNDKQLLKKAEVAFRKSKKLNSQVSLKEEGYFGDTVFYLSDNFGLSKDGIVFYYNQYDIAAYALGPSEIVLSYKEIDAFLKPDFKKNLK